MKKIFIIDGPSGCGKTTLALELEKSLLNAKYIASTTIRDKRPEEIEGREHFFVSPEKFEIKRKNGDFLGFYDMYFNRYGIEKNKILDAKEDNIILTYHCQEGTLMADIENINIPYITTLILPNDKDTLRDRIKNRNSKIIEKEIVVRLEKYEFLKSIANKYDNCFINEQGKMSELVNNMRKIILQD